MVLQDVMLRYGYDPVVLHRTDSLQGALHRPQRAANRVRRRQQ